VEDGVVKKLNLETGGPFGVSSAQTMLEQLGA
jgi:peroxiredoxin